MEFSSEHDIFFTGELPFLPKFYNRTNSKNLGFVSWVGNSSMEVTLRANQCSQRLLEAKFIMVTLSADGKGKEVNVPLRVTNQAEREMFQQAEGSNSNFISLSEDSKQTFIVAKQNRIKRDTLMKDVLKMDKTEIKSLWTEVKETQTMQSNSSNEAEIGVCPMSNTKLQKALPSNQEFDNAFGNVSGEWLMSEAYDLATTNINQTLYGIPFKF